MEQPARSLPSESVSLTKPVAKSSSAGCRGVSAGKIFWDGLVEEVTNELAKLDSVPES